MKYRTDAKIEANRIIKEHKSNGLNNINAIKCSIITVKLIISVIRYGTMNHSLYKRTLNYLESL
jgi:hypothetical protein